MRRIVRHEDASSKLQPATPRTPRREIQSLPSGYFDKVMLVDLQRSAGNAALVGAMPVARVQRTPAAAKKYMPDSRNAMNVDFWNHHTPHGQTFDKTTCEAVAKANHEARARDGLNTTLDMNGEDAQREIRRYLEDLGDHDAESAALGDHRSITFETRGEYLFVTTEWNGGDPVSYQVDRGYAIVRMQYNHGSYQIYHLDGMS